MVTTCCEALQRALQFCEELERLSEELGIETGWIEILFLNGRPHRVDLFLRGAPLGGAGASPPEETAAGGSPSDLRDRLGGFALEHADHCTIAFGAMKIWLREDRIQDIKATELFKPSREVETRKLAAVFAA